MYGHYQNNFNQPQGFHQNYGEYFPDQDPEVDELAQDMDTMNFGYNQNAKPHRNNYYYSSNRGNNRRRGNRNRGRGNRNRRNNYGNNNAGGEYHQNFQQPRHNMYVGYQGNPNMGTGPGGFNQTQMVDRGMEQMQNFYGMQPAGNYLHRIPDEIDAVNPQIITCSEDIKGRVYALARTQNGCRQLQKLLDKEPAAWEIIYEELEGNFPTLVTDPFGHHLCLRLLDFITDKTIRENLLMKLKEDLVAVSLSVHGTRVIQKLLEMMQTAKELSLVQESMSMYVITLAKDVYGMHVILRCLHRIPPPGDKADFPSNQFIFDEITKNIVSVATHKHGCCVVQWCIDYATPAQRKKLVDVIVQNSLELSQDAFGNYVVQQIMDPTHPGVLQKLVSHLQGSITKLAVQKFSSIVIEKCLEYTESEQQMQIINELVNPAKLPRLLQDPYANYVIQKALSVTRQENFQKVVSLIRPHLASLSNTPFGKRIKTQMIRRFPILSMGPKTPYVFGDSGTPAAAGQTGKQQEAETTV